jgi:hypothetical protein
MRHLAIFALVVIAFSACTAAIAAEWRPADGPLMTRWAAELTPENAWREYPRPQMVRKEWTNLNGLWQYAIRPKAEDQPSEWDGEILVPFAVESALSGVKKPVSPDERLWYRRTFEKPATPEGGRLLLHFGAVDWQCTVWVNGKEVGEHKGGFDPFSFDIAGAVRDGENEIVVAVWDPTDSSYQPRGKQVRKPEGIWYTAVTGIWQTAWLEPTPRQAIDAVHIVPDLDRGLASITVSAPEGAKVRVAATSGGAEAASAEGEAGQPIELKIASAKLWSPDDPHLYDLRVELLADGKPVDTVDSYFGMRKIEVAKDEQGVNRLMLNGQPLFQYGPLDQGWWPDGLYTPASDAALVHDVEMTKKFGMNMARKHVKLEIPRWYYHCDKLGLLVWQDMPSSNVDDDDAEAKANFRRELKLIVDAVRNHPSIVMWVPFNEGWGQHDVAGTVAWLEAYDPSRPVNEASGWHDRGTGTVSDMHNYPGPGMRPVEERRVSVLGEFGGLGMPITGHKWQDKANWGYVSYDTKEKLTDAYVALLTAMRPLIGEGLSAAVYTQTSDVEIEVNGLMTYDRELVKMDLDRIAAAARRLYGPPPTVSTLVPTSEREKQSWRYTFEEPAAAWSEPGFDDAAWQEGEGGFGTPNTPGAVVGTEWNGSDVWLRRTFELDSVPEGDLGLRVHHDEDVEVYLNGKLIARAKGHTSSYGFLACDGDARQALQEGENVLAVHCRQTAGGQFIDVGLQIVKEQAGTAATASTAAETSAR